MAHPEKAQGIVRTHVAWSMGAGMIPLPIVDFVAVTAVQLDMLRELAAAYDKDFSEAAGKSWISALGGTYLARLGAQAIKAIPGWGSVVGGVSMGVLSGASTFAIGQVFIRHFESGGDFFDVDIDGMKDFFEEKFEEGKEFAREMQREEKQSPPQSRQSKKSAHTPPSGSSDAITRLRKLKDMRDRGALSPEEFEALKRKILADL